MVERSVVSVVHCYDFFLFIFNFLILKGLCLNYFNPYSDSIHEAQLRGLSIGWLFFKCFQFQEEI